VDVRECERACVQQAFDFFGEGGQNGFQINCQDADGVEGCGQGCACLFRVGFDCGPGLVLLYVAIGEVGQGGCGSYYGCVIEILIVLCNLIIRGGDCFDEFFAFVVELTQPAVELAFKHRCGS
jgi:hypothetical protein